MCGCGETASNSTWDGEVREAEAAENTTDEVDSENTECESESAKDGLDIGARKHTSGGWQCAQNRIWRHYFRSTSGAGHALASVGNVSRMQVL